MINILFIGNNYDYLKNLINKVMEQNTNVRLFKLLTNEKEALQVLKTDYDKIDIVLLDLKLPESNNIDILKELESEKIYKYNKSIIVLSNNPNVIQELKHNNYVYTCISNETGLQSTLNNINDLIRIKEFTTDTIENQVLNELKKINYNLSYIGTKYIYESILILCNSITNEKIKLEKNIYPIVAEKYNTTINTVKTDIVNSTNEMYYDCKKEVLNKYFGFCDNEKPTPKQVIFLVASNIKHSYFF